MIPLKALAHASLNFMGAFYLWNNNSVKAFSTAMVVRWLIVCVWAVDAVLNTDRVGMIEHAWSHYCGTKICWGSFLLLWHTHWERHKAGWHAVTVCVCVWGQDYVRLMESVGLNWCVLALFVCVWVCYIFFLVQRCCSDSWFLFSLLNRPGCWLAERQNKTLNALKCAGVVYGRGPYLSEALLPAFVAYKSSSGHNSTVF